MQAKLFYETQGDRVTSLYLMSHDEWTTQKSKFTAVESNRFALHQFEGNLGDSCFIFNAEGLIDQVYIGSGDEQQDQAMAIAALLLPPGCYQVQGICSQEALMSWALAQYRFEVYKKNAIKPRVLMVDLDRLNDLLILVQAQFLVRDLINKPPSDLGPKEMADVVEQLARTHHAEFKQWIGEELVANNFPAIHAVGRASKSAPRLLSLTWGNPEHPRIALVGKGVCFDTGGLDIKSSAGMRIMKKDMGGAAHVIGLAQWIMARHLPIRLHILIPAVENSIGPDAYRPGDILTMRNGLTVEVHNTDAEGRLVLADALVKACEEAPELLIDFATLTGAARVSVGSEIAAFFTNSDSLATDVSGASFQAADPVWRLPLFGAYEEFLRSNIADLSNASEHPYAGAIIAGLFLQRFVPKTISWIHFDIMAWNLSSKPGRPEGGEAMGFRTIAAYLLNTYS